MSKSNSEAFDTVEQLRSRAEEMIEGLNFQDINRRIRDFGRQNPVGLALAALTVGVATGLLLKNSLRRD